jgi:HTH-type transcriptional regulator/antitoxin HigA
VEEEVLRLLIDPIRGRMEPERAMNTQVVPRTYLKLIRKFPLRPIRSDEELDRAIAMVDALGSRVNDLAPDERDYLDVLADLVEKYETARYPESVLDPPAMIRELIAARGITQADVARGTGIAGSMLSEVLAGKRPMGRKTIETLSRFFHVDPSVFFPSEGAGPGTK